MANTGRKKHHITFTKLATIYGEFRDIKLVHATHTPKTIVTGATYITEHIKKYLAAHCKGSLAVISEGLSQLSQLSQCQTPDEDLGVRWKRCAGVYRHPQGSW